MVLRKGQVKVGEMEIISEVITQNSVTEMTGLQTTSEPGEIELSALELCLIEEAWRVGLSQVPREQEVPVDQQESRAA